MQSTSPSAEARAQLLSELFPAGVPSLWCPLLTHYDAKGAVSEPRTVAQLRHLSPFVKGFLMPGSTGDGWELKERQTRQVIDIALAQAQNLEFSLLIGILKPNAQAALEAIEQIVEHIKSQTSESDALLALKKARVCAFALCPPSGRDVQQEDMVFAFSALLETGLPIALYQLPQITKNEVSAGTIKELADRFPNLVLFKDSSGSDRVILSGKDLGGLFRVRGAETDYCKWLDGSRVRYDGFLLSTANCFAGELARMIELCQAGKAKESKQISDRLSAIILEVFQVVSPIRIGNAFANANKAMDHLFAFGSKAMDAPPPRLYDGSSIPLEIMRRTAEVLARHDVLPRNGYL